MTSFIAAATGTTTCTIPAHQAKDRFIIFCLRDGSSSAPGMISGWQLLDTSLANSAGSRIYTREVHAGETLSDPSSASATNMVCLQYRPDSGKRLDIGKIVVGQFASGNWTYNAATFVQDNNTSWAVGVGGHRNGDTNMQDAPTGMTNRSNHAPGTNEAAGHDSNGPVTGWSSQTITATGTSGASVTWVIELREEADGVMPRYLGFEFSNTDASSYTFTDAAVGDSDDGASYHMAISARFAGTTAITLDSVTCDGNAANIDVQVENSPTNGNLAAIATIAAPSAVTDIVLTFSATVVRVRCDLYRGPGTLSDSATSTADAPTTSAVALTAGGYALAAVATAAQPNVMTGTNIVAGPSATQESSSHHGSGYFAAVDDEAARAMTLTFSSALESVGAFAGYSASSVDALAANDVESDSEVSVPAIGQVHAILANDVQSTSNVTAPALGQVHALAANDVESASEVSVPAAGISHVLLANDVESASEVTSPALGQAHGLLAGDVQSASELTAPALGQVHALLATDVESTSEVTSPALAEVGGAPTVDQHDGGSADDYRRLRAWLKKRRERIQALEARAEVVEERIEEVREDEPDEPISTISTISTPERPVNTLAPLIAELQTIRAEIHRLRTEDDEEAMTMLLVA